MIFCREVYILLRCQNRKQHISKRNYEITIVQEIHISKLELQRCSLVVLSFSKIFLEFWIDFEDHVLQISIRQMNFQHIYFPNYAKLKYFVYSVYWFFARTCVLLSVYNVVLKTEKFILCSRVPPNPPPPRPKCMVMCKCGCRGGGGGGGSTVLKLHFSFQDSK
jgi:hypothetical protein